MGKFNSRVSKFQIVDNETYVAKADDGGAFTTESTEAQDDTANDMTLLPAAPLVDDAYYFGSDGKFGGIWLQIGTQGAGSWTIVWEYWDGSSWTDISASDQSVGFTAAAGKVLVTWPVPSDWVAKSVDSVSKYWVRARVSVFGSISAQPLGTQAWLVRDMSEFLTEVSGLPGERELNDSSTFGDAGRERHPSLENGIIRLAGFYDDESVRGPDAVFGPLRTHDSEVHFNFGPSGKASGDERYYGDCWVRRYEIGARIGELVGWTAELEVHGQVTRDTYT